MIMWGESGTGWLAPSRPLDSPRTRQETNPMASYRKRGKVWYFRYSDADGVKHELKGCSDKRATEELARQKESEVAKIKAAVLDPYELVRLTHGARPISEHLNEYRSYLIAKGATPKHTRVAVYRARRVAALAKADRLTQLSASRVQE